jgi:hypothetical protein
VTAPLEYRTNRRPANPAQDDAFAGVFAVVSGTRYGVAVVWRINKDRPTAVSEALWGSLEQELQETIAKAKT